MSESKPDTYQMATDRLPSYSFAPSYLSGESAWVQHLPFAYDLIRQCRPGVLVELGAWNGDSFFTMCQSVADHRISCLCYAVDHWKGDSQAGYVDGSQFARVQRYCAAEYGHFAYLMRTDFDSAVSEFADGSIDLLHIDGFHTYEAVSNDFSRWLPKVKKGGIILLHDIAVRSSEEHPDFGVWQLWNELKKIYKTYEFHHGYGLGILVNGGNAPLEQWLAGACCGALRDYYPAKGRAVELFIEVEGLTRRLAQRNLEYAQFAQFEKLAIAKEEGLTERLQQASDLVKNLQREQKELRDEQSRLEINVKGLSEKNEKLTQAIPLRNLQIQREREIHQYLAIIRSQKSEIEALQAKVGRIHDLAKLLHEHAATPSSSGLSTLLLPEVIAVVTQNSSIENRQLTEIFKARQIFDAAYESINSISRTWPGRWLVSERARNRADQQYRETLKSRSKKGSEVFLQQVEWTISSWMEILTSVAKKPLGSKVVSKVLIQDFKEKVGKVKEGLKQWSKWETERRLASVPYLFDKTFYQESAACKTSNLFEAFAHYEQHGWRNGIDPHPLFDVKWYLEKNPDIAERGIDPLQHYVDKGWKEQRSPHPLFDIEWYTENNPDVLVYGMDPLRHYLFHGWKEGRNPNSVFDVKWYLEKNPDVVQGKQEPLRHYVLHGAQERRNPARAFWSEWYAQQHDLPKQVDALQHYLLLGRKMDAAINPAQQVAKLREEQGRTPPGFWPSDRNIGEFKPLVTVVVPNFNHGPYLEKRLESIYGQTYRPIKVLLLDDCSTDGSEEILERFARKHEAITEVIRNERNSGNVFRQWAKGVSLCKSSLLWIAESDDYCDPNLLETLVPYFRDEAVQIAYTRSTFVNKTGDPVDFSFEGYVGELHKTKWLHEYVETAHNEVSSALGIRNSIPNVSSAVFKTPADLPLLEDESWLSMRICGDWLFYLHVARGGKIAFSPLSTNYYRQHGNNTSTNTHTLPIYYKEHEMVAKTVARLYNVPPETLEGHHRLLEQFWHYQKQKDAHYQPDWHYSDFYDRENIEAERHGRKPNVWIAGHDFVTGGGEVFPIQLAKALRAKGFAVTFFDFNGKIGKAGFRAKLPDHVPLIQNGGEAFKFLEKAMTDFGVEIINTHHASTDAYFNHQLLNRSAPLHVVTMHGMYELHEELLEENTGKLFPRVDHWVFTGQKNIVPFQKRALFDKNKFTFIGLGVDDCKNGSCSVARAELGVPEQAFVLCVASRAIKEKGWGESIEAVRLARELTTVDIHLVLVGGGEMYDLLAKESLPNFVHLTGFKPHPADYFSIADAGLLATSYKGETYPMVICECLMSGKPVIASDVGEIKHMLAAGPGEYAGALIELVKGSVPVQNLAAIIASFAERSEVYQTALRRVKLAAKRCHIETVAEQYDGLFKRLVAGLDSKPASSPPSSSASDINEVLVMTGNTPFEEANAG